LRRKPLSQCVVEYGIARGIGEVAQHDRVFIGESGRLDDAKAVVRQAQTHNIDSSEIHFDLYWIAFLQNDTAGMEREAAGLMGKPGYEDRVLNAEADTALYGGQLAKARMLTRHAIESARKVDEKEAAALCQADAAVPEALVGKANAAKEQAKAALALSRSGEVEAFSATALALAGDSTYSIQLAEDLGKRFPQNTIVQSNYLPTIQAAVLLWKGDTGKATEALAAAIPRELGSNETLNFVLYPVYLRGQVYLAAKQGAAAAAEFQKILDQSRYRPE
jgi:hypothetical protein